ncbi:hypothetical protein HZA97_05160 [Candidatus Woesearchaeota archaeon]|nr:hypothetical protein [Candidatus Woesearchaeota archaeon]
MTKTNEEGKEIEPYKIDHAKIAALMRMHDEDFTPVNDHLVQENPPPKISFPYLSTIFQQYPTHELIKEYPLQEDLSYYDQPFIQKKAKFGKIVLPLSGKFINPFTGFGNKEIPIKQVDPCTFQKETRTLKPTQHADLSKEYAEKIRALPAQIPQEQLEGILSLLRLGPLMTAAQILAETLSDKQKSGVPGNTRTKIETLVNGYRTTIDPQSDLSKLLDGARIKTSTFDIFNTETGTVEDLNQLLNDAHACSHESGSLKGSKVEAFFEDQKAGGCINVGVRKKALIRRNKTAYNRLNLAHGRDGKVFLFHDCIESGDMSRYHLNEYLSNGLEEMLVTSFIGTIAIAQLLGIEKVAFGDHELVEMAQNLGFGETQMFDNEGSPLEKKLGYTCKEETGFRAVYAWRMDKRTYRNTNSVIYTPQALQTRLAEAYQVLEAAKQRKKKVIVANQQDYKTYFGIIQEVMKKAKDLLEKNACEELQTQIESFYERYGISKEEQGVLAA